MVRYTETAARSGWIAAGVLASIVAFACGTDDPEKTFGEPSSSGGASGGASSGGVFATKDAGKPDVDQFANDPPAPWCGPTSQPTPPKPGGTLECPDDKNKPGCPCTKVGEKAACWTGLRKQRGHGQCKDGVTTCTFITETSTGFGPCEGEVLPSAGAAKGAAACGCFSKGAWKIQNTSPCFATSAPGTYIGAVSTVVNAAGQSACPAISNPLVAPGAPWSTNTLNTDCAGKFKLCYTIKAGNFDMPAATDCVITSQCTEADYPKENVEQTFPVLPAWVNNDGACAKRFNEVGGYGEMTVVGKSVLCDEIDDGMGKPRMFNRVKYCPASCANGSTAPECVSCGQGGGGTF
jgi:hypothetical protein